MDVQSDENKLLCRMCLCKCENPKNMLVETEFATKVMQVFPKIQISTENGLSNLVCDYCHNLILQFYEYFETVNTNQDEFVKMMTNVQKEEIFAVSIEKPEEIPEIPMLDMKVSAEDVHSDEDAGWFDNDGPMDSPVEKHFEQPHSPKYPEILELPKRPYKRKEKIHVEYSKEELLKLNYFDLKKLPINFTYSYLCPLCPESERFRIRSLLKLHIMQKHLTHLHHKERPDEAQAHIEKFNPQCDKCNKAIPMLKKNQIHQDHKFIHYDIKPYQCELCNYTSNGKANLREHIKKHRKRLERQWCQYCMKYIPVNESRNKHMRVMHQENMITCDLCGQMLAGKRLAEKHFHEHLKKASMLECERCIGGIRFPDERVLALHKNQHELQDKKGLRLSCHLCERTFNTDNLFQEHLGYHASDKLKPCGICGKSVVLDTNRKRAQHAKTHLDKPDSYHCSKCDAVFPKRRSLSEHTRKVHDPKEQSCYRCGKMIAAHLMKRHLNYCIGGTKPCMYCPMQFARVSERMKHTQDCHVGYFCKRCGIKFENRTQLLFHQRYDQKHGRRKNASPKTSKEQT